MKFILTIMMAIGSSLVFSQGNYTLNMPEIRCLKTTEDSEDEIYFIIIYQIREMVNGSTPPINGFVKVPDEHWSMNDGTRLHRIIEANNLFNFDLKVGQQIDILCLMMEEDDSKGWFAKYLSDDIFNTIAAHQTKLTDLKSPELKFFLDRYINRDKAIYEKGVYGTDTDEWIGGFAMHFDYFNNVDLYRYVENPNGCCHVAIIPTDAPLLFDFSGDGAHYTGVINISHLPSKSRPRTITPARPKPIQ